MDKNETALQPGKKCWITIDEEYQEGRKKIRYRTLGADGSLTYVTFQVIGGNTFMVFDEAQGHGKQTKVRSFSINADRIIYAGMVDNL
jgi:hypothetical protein